MSDHIADAGKMVAPSGAEIARFLEVFDTLDKFEAQQHMIRGYGAFDRATTAMPDPATVKVHAWLMQHTVFST